MHLNHGVRGADADTDEQFVLRVADDLGIPVLSEMADLPAGVKVGEETLRNERMAFFANSGCSAILLGHHADDVAETLLMRLCRGAGTEGLAAPRPISQPNQLGGLHLRPMLDWSREAIESAMKTARIPWREDDSNAKLDYFRNRVRHRVWPELTLASPVNALAGTTRSRTLLHEDAVALEQWLDAVYPSTQVEAELPASLFVGMPKALWRRGLLRWISHIEAHGSLSARAIDDLLERWMAGESVRVSVGTSQFIEGDQKQRLRLVGANEEAPCWREQALPFSSAIALPNGYWLHARLAKLDDSMRTRILRGDVSETRDVYLSPGDPSPPWQIRLWRPGDRYHPLGAPGSRKLQDCFTDRRIPERERNRLPVVCDGSGTIVWVPGLPPNEKRRLSAEAESALWLTYQPF